MSVEDIRRLSLVRSVLRAEEEPGAKLPTDIELMAKAWLVTWRAEN